jgi:hypothetical protein
LNSTTRYVKSRESWKRKAIQRDQKLKNANKKVRRRDIAILKLKEENNQLRKTLTDKENVLHASQPSPIIYLQHARYIQVLCVVIVILATVSFRSVPRIMKLLRSTSKINIPWIPHFTSVINWTLRVGLYCLERISPIEDPWIAMLDFTKDIGVKKALVVLRVKLSELRERGSALTLQDCQCIGVEIREDWNGKSICSALSKIFSISGTPVAILKDNGTDLRKGVRLWRESMNLKSIPVLEDVGHIIANALKKTFKDKKSFINFIKTLHSGGGKLRQSDLAFLSPPKIRTKGRFQSIEKVGVWGTKILEMIGGQGRRKIGSVAQRLREFFSNFGSHRKIIEEFAKTATVTRDVNKILKNEGLNQSTYKQVKSLLTSLSEDSICLTKWLNTHLHYQSRLGIGQTPLPVSTDILESLFGKFKIVIQRNPKAEFNRISLIIPCLCGDFNKSLVQEALLKTSHADLMLWEKNNVNTSMAKQRRAYFKKEDGGQNRGQSLSS